MNASSSALSGRSYFNGAAIICEESSDCFQEIRTGGIDPMQPYAPRQSGPSRPVSTNSQEPSSNHARAWAIASSYESERPADSAAVKAASPSAPRARAISGMRNASSARSR